MMAVTAVLTYMTTLGFGTHIWDIDLSHQEKMMLPTNIVATFSIVASVWCKTSFGVTLLHVTDGWIKKTTWFCIISMNMAVFLSALFVWINCTPIKKTWNYYMEGTCWDPLTLSPPSSHQKRRTQSQPVGERVEIKPTKSGSRQYTKH